MKLADLPVLIGVFFLGLAALIISAVLQVKNGTSPSEYLNLASTAMGVLGGAYMGARLNNPNPNNPKADPPKPAPMP
jgi:hypothetical protein